MKNDMSLSRRHCVIDFSRTFTNYRLPYKFIVLLLSLTHKSIIIPKEIIRYIFEFIKKPKEILVFPNKPLTQYVRIQDLGSSVGTFIRINNCIIEKNQKFHISDEILTIEKVRNESILYTDNFFRGIDTNYLLRIHSDYLENVYQDREANYSGKCGFPYVQCSLKRGKYFLVATRSKLEFTIGRNTLSDLFIDSPEVSRCHCRICYDTDKKM